MVVIAADNSRRLGHVATGRTYRSKVHHHRELCDTFDYARIGKIRIQKFATFVVQPVLNSVEINIDSENAPLGSAQNGIQQMAANKTTAADYGHGDGGIVKLQGQVYSVTVNLPDFPFFLVLA